MADKKIYNNHRLINWMLRWGL